MIESKKIKALRLQKCFLKGGCKVSCFGGLTLHDLSYAKDIIESLRRGYG